MGIANDMKDLAEDIVASYGLRAKASSLRIEETKRTLRGFAAERKRMSEKQARELSRFVAGLRRDVATMLKGIQKGHKEMSAKLKADLKKGESDRLEDFKGMMRGVQKEIKGIETYVKNKLKEFSDAHADMSEELKKMLAKYVDNIVKEVSELLRGFRTEREKMAANWWAMTETMAKKRGGIAPKIEAEVKVREDTKAIEEEKGTEEEETAEGGEDVERQILRLLRDYPDGATLSELGDRMGIHFVRLTKPMRDLAAEGMVKKVDNRYLLV